MTELAELERIDGRSADPKEKRMGFYGRATGSSGDMTPESVIARFQRFQNQRPPVF